MKLTRLIEHLQKLSKNNPDLYVGFVNDGFMGDGHFYYKNNKIPKLAHYDENTGQLKDGIPNVVILN